MDHMNGPGENREGVPSQNPNIPTGNVHDYPPASHDQYANPETMYYGVKGWLLLFCVILTIISPVGGTIVIFTGMPVLLEFVGRFPKVVEALICMGILSAGVMAFSIYAGIALWTIRRGAVKIAKIFLVVYLVYASGIPFLLLMVGLPPSYDEGISRAVFKGIIRGLVFFGVWFAYLTKSKRVKATYGRAQELSPAPDQHGEQEPLT